MKITILNGCPKGSVGNTMQYVYYIRTSFPQHDFVILDVAKEIEKIEDRESFRKKIIRQIEDSDGVLWASPVYVQLVPSQYKRFIELIFEKNLAEVFKDKYASILTTSVNFYDHTAHNYLHAICDDLGMKYITSFSAEMDDLLKEAQRKRLRLFSEIFFEAMEQKIPAARTYQPVKQQSLDYIPGKRANNVDKGNLRMLILTDCRDPGSNLSKMTGRFKSFFSEDVEIVNISDILKIGCSGCLSCGYDNVCSYHQMDNFNRLYAEKIKAADILIFCGEVKDRYLSSQWKMFFDRSFFNTHIPQLIDKQAAFIISGPLYQLADLKQIFEAYIEWQRANLAGFVTDECADSQELDARLEQLAEKTVRYAKKGYVKPPTFLSVGGMKIFRDMIWGKLRPGLQADYRYYKKHHLFDFPRYDYGTRFMNINGMLLTKIHAIRKIFYKNIKNILTRKHRRILKSMSRRNDNAE